MSELPRYAMANKDAEIRVLKARIAELEKQLAIATAWATRDMDAPSVPAGDAQIEHLKNAIEGECVGLAITDQQARAILEYVSAAAVRCRCVLRRALHLARSCCRLSAPRLTVWQ